MIAAEVVVVRVQYRLGRCAMLALLLALGACGGGDADGRPGTPSPTPSETATAPPEIEALPDGPTRTIESLAKDPCSIMTDEEASELLGIVVGSQPPFQGMCSWGRTEPQASDWLSQVRFQARPKGGGGNGTADVDGHQASVWPVGTGCEVIVRVTGQASIQVGLQPNQFEIDSCDLASRVAAVLLPRID